MTSYRMAAPPGPRRSFCLTFGLPFFSGVLSPADVLYAWPEGPGRAASRAEPAAEFRGEVSPLYWADLPDAEAREVLCELAAVAGGALGQERVYASFLGEAWVLEQV